MHLAEHWMDEDGSEVVHLFVDEPRCMYLYQRPSREFICYREKICILFLHPRRPCCLCEGLVMNIDFVMDGLGNCEG